MTVNYITDKIIVVIGARNGPVLADPAAPYPFDPACLGPRD